ncbi:DUF1684 domain-containing protein [Aerolutibacter ruishenii]|uniref:DUF1684 domain-containing protein n=1 Tax=Aerolutibacter ruishenii TaxID=686800 RepID=A0A562LY31_9GAMM|nr:DUF1684 domain-containing protein [Lysobacter ruishenii]TWI12547.1 hypothetical protein IP93_00889 [Lysobacter ruishenii]
MRLIPLLLGATVALASSLLVGCNKDDDTGVATRTAEDAAFDASQQAWREQRAAGLLKPDGWTSLVGLHWIEPGSHYIGSDADNGMRLAAGPAHLGLLTLKGDRLRFTPESSVTVTIDGAALKGDATLRTDADPAGPSVLGFDEGKGIATVIKRGQRHALRVKHADAPTRAGFAGLDYWPADRSWRVPARFVPHPAGKTLDVVNIIGTVEPVANPGAVEFEREGKHYRLEALDEGDGKLFLILADRTSGHGSYGAGRYLYADPPDAQGKVLLDFNQAYNPPCAFTSFATCPLPPPENRLDLQITAGEKTYAKKL